jgi:hypothetical protein
MATKEDNASIDVSKPKLEKFHGNDRDTLDIKTWCLQVSRLDTVQKLGDESTAIIVMEALREQALSWALLLQHEKPASAASWKLLQPLLLERFELSTRRKSSSSSQPCSKGRTRVLKTSWTAARLPGMGYSGN